MTNSEMQDQLNQYALEMGVEEFTLARLINSHRYLRGLKLVLFEARQDAIEKSRKTVYEDAKRYALENDWISVEKIKGMKMSELAELLYEGEE
jgi:hypothetical protein